MCAFMAKVKYSCNIWGHHLKDLNKVIKKKKNLLEVILLYQYYRKAENKEKLSRGASVTWCLHFLHLSTGQ